MRFLLLTGLMTACLLLGGCQSSGVPWRLSAAEKRALLVAEDRYVSQLNKPAYAQYERVITPITAKIREAGNASCDRRADMGTPLLVYLVLNADGIPVEVLPNSPSLFHKCFSGIAANARFPAPPFVPYYILVANDVNGAILLGVERL